MSEQESAPRIRRPDAVEYEDVDAADGLSKGVLIGEEHDAPNFAMRRFVLDPGTEVPKHTNEVEHVQYVLEGEYVVGFGEGGGKEQTVSAGDSLLVPEGVVHWYRNEGEAEGAFICVVPHGDDEIELVE